MVDPLFVGIPAIMADPQVAGKPALSGAGPALFVSEMIGSQRINLKNMMHRSILKTAVSDFNFSTVLFDHSEESC